MKFKTLCSFAKEHDIELNDKQINQFEQFAEILIEKNKVMNLTSITDPAEIEVKHMIDSIEAAELIRNIGPADFKLLDIGCGAGFPGIPLSIVFPENQITLLDSLTKRINFVNETLNELHLSNAHGIALRAEDLQEKAEYDFCTSRAVARMNVLLEYCLPFVKVGGCCILYKSGEIEEELQEVGKAIDELGGKLSQVISVELPNNCGARSLVVIQKVKDTPEKYPRRAGKPAKSPIK